MVFLHTQGPLMISGIGPRSTFFKFQTQLNGCLIAFGKKPQQTFVTSSKPSLMLMWIFSEFIESSSSFMSSPSWLNSGFLLFLWFMPLAKLLVRFESKLDRDELVSDGFNTSRTIFVILEKLSSVDWIGSFRNFKLFLIVNLNSVKVGKK